MTTRDLLPAGILAALCCAALAPVGFSQVPAVPMVEANECCNARCCCTCPGDYCSKPLPCVPCAPLGKCDSYCKKPLPCPPCRSCYCAPDDYCPKSCCIYLPPCWPTWYSCGPSCDLKAK